MPTDIERSYEEQGYKLPPPLTWERVADLRAAWGVRDILVPVALSHGLIAWAVPDIGGVPLRHP